MKTKLLLATLAITLLVNIQTAQGLDPATNTQNCIDKVTNLSQDFAATMLAKADGAATKITALLANGKTTSAQRLAARTIKSIRSIRNRGLNRVNSIADPCFFKLAEAGQVELAGQVLAAAVPRLVATRPVAAPRHTPAGARRRSSIGNRLWRRKQ